MAEKRRPKYSFSIGEGPIWKDNVSRASANIKILAGDSNVTQKQNLFRDRDDTRAAKKLSSPPVNGETASDSSGPE